MTDRPPIVVRVDRTPITVRAEIPVVVVRQPGIVVARAGGDVTPLVSISQQAENALSRQPDGLYVPSPTVQLSTTHW